MAKKPKNFSLRNHIEKTLRDSFRKTPMYNEAKRRAKEDYFEPSKNGKPMRRVHYKCASCGLHFLDKTGFKQIALDHILPVIDPLVGWVDYNTYIERLFCSIDNLQVLCKPCHSKKSIAEGGTRKQTRTEKTAKEKGINADTIKQKKRLTSSKDSK
jgi:5-methylcytosine-specific restriction endonuclease McrA